MTVFGLDKFRVERRGIEPVRVEILLPNLPPSTNHLYFNAKHGGRVKTSAYDSWITYSGLSINRQKPQRINGPVQILIEAEDRHARRDISNIVKPLEDLLVRMKVIHDDNAKHVRSITAKWAPGIEGVRITITQEGRGG